jgi:hypothetical protein
MIMSGLQNRRTASRYIHKCTRLNKCGEPLHNTISLIRCTTQERQAAVATSAYDITTTASRYQQQQWEAGTSNRSGQPAERNLHANTAMLETQQLRLFSRGSHHRVIPSTFDKPSSAKPQRARARVANIWQAKVCCFLISPMRLANSCHEVHDQPQHNTTDA